MAIRSDSSSQFGATISDSSADFPSGSDGDADITDLGGVVQFSGGSISPTMAASGTITTPLTITGNGALDGGAISATMAASGSIRVPGQNIGIFDGGAISAEMSATGTITPFVFVPSEGSGSDKRRQLYGWFGRR